MPDGRGFDRVGGYASAILEVAQAEGELERVERELFAVAQTFSNSNELREALTNPQLGSDLKRSIVDELLGGRASDVTVGLIKLIVGQGHASVLPDIVNSFVTKAAATRAKAVAEIRSAIPLEPATLDRLARALSKATGKDLEVKAVVDPGVVGGIVATVGDMVFDGSVARKLASARQALNV
ncbi:MAG: ATP synthase F1 subunit delta [Actinomycetota bacterium]